MDQDAVINSFHLLTHLILKAILFIFSYLFMSASKEPEDHTS